MRILMVHPHDIHSPVEPWTIRIKCLAQELVKNGYQVRLIYFPLNNNGDPKSHFLDGYEVIPFNRYPSPLIFLKNTLKFVNLGKWADVIYFQKCHHYAAVPAVVAAYLNRKPLHYDWDDWEEMIWYESCGENLHSKFIGFSFKILERFLPILSDTVSVASENLRNLALQFGVKEENIFFVPVGVDLSLFNPDINGDQIKKIYNITGSLVLYIGQLHGAQHIDLFINAANVILYKNQNVFFMIVGEGFMERQLRDLVEELCIEDRVIFTGSVPHHKIPEYIAAADICVAPFRDTKVTRCKSPLKIVEYMAMGKAVVASNVGEVKRMLGGAGILVEPGDYFALAEGIWRLLTDKTLRKNLEKFTRLRGTKEYTWSKTASSLLMAYEKLCS